MLLKQKVSQRIIAVLLACIFLFTAALPVGASDFDNLTTIVDMTGNDSSSTIIEPEESSDDTQEWGGSPPSWEDESYNDIDSQSTPPRDDSSLNNMATSSLGASGAQYTLLPEAPGYFSLGTNTKARAFNESTRIYYIPDPSISHIWPFSGGTQVFPLYKFYTAEGEMAFCVEPTKFNSYTGHPVTGSLTYHNLSASKQNQIARAVAANTDISNSRLYAAQQAIIWEIGGGQSHRSGSIYRAVIVANGLQAEYEQIMSIMKDLNGEIPSFTGHSIDDAPYHEMIESGGKWTITLPNSNSNVSLRAGDFRSVAALSFNVAGNNLTITSDIKPQRDSFVTWAPEEEGSGAIFWMNDTVQDKVSVRALSGIGYMRFENSAKLPDEEDEEDPRLGFLTIYKFDGETNLPLGGASFAIECETFRDDGFVVPYGGATLAIPIPEGKDSLEVTVREVSPPANYQLNTTSKTVTVYASDIVNISEVGFDNYPNPSSLRIYKHEKGKVDTPLAGARFRIRYADAAVSAQTWELTTDSNGYITIDPLPAAGTLVLEELSAPIGYVIGEISSWTITVAPGEQKEHSVSNDKLAQMVVYKRDSVDSTLLAGATFQAKLLRSFTEPYESGIIYTATSGSNGEAHFTNLIPGSYEVRELSPPSMYLPSSKVETVNVYDNSVESVKLYWENDRFSGLTLIKVDSISGERLQGAIFSLYKGTEAHPTDFLGSYQSNENGMVIIENLPSDQWYTAIEQQPPFGYELDPDNQVQTVYLKAQDLNQNITLYYRNPPRPKLELIKEDENSNRLPGAVFRLSKEGSIDYIDIQVGADGRAIVANLEPDVTYKLIEIRSPSGFVLSDEIRYFKIGVGETHTEVVVNKHLPKFKLKKVNELDGKGIAGITFKITRQDDGSEQYITTGPGGIIEEYFEPGWIIVEETHAPGYVLDPTPRYYLLDDDVEVQIENKPLPSITIKKICSVTKQPLQATFEVKIKNGMSLGSFTTNPETGEVEIPVLDYSSDPLILELSEIRAPSGYLITEKSREISIKWGENRIIEWYNTPENPILILKEDKDGTPLKNTEFLVTTVTGEHVGLFRSGINGYAVVSGVEPGWYLVQETKTASDEYIRDEETQLVELRYGSPAVCRFVNHKKPILEIVKRSKGDNSVMQGVLIRVERLDGSLIGDYRTDFSGRISLQTDPGWVSVYELETLPGFQLDQTRHTVLLEPNGRHEIPLFNIPLQGFQLQKIDSVTKLPMSDVIFEIRKLDGALLGPGQYTTDAQGIIYLQTDEEYIVVQEIRTNEGYRISSQPRTIRLAPGVLHREKWENTPYPTLVIEKLDEKTKAPLPGTRYKLFDSYMREVGIYRSNELGRIVLTGMNEGKYFLQEYETSSPEYILDRTVHEISLSYGKETKLTLTNKRTGNFKLRKVSEEDGRPLADATYLIYDTKGNLLFEKTTDIYGYIVLENMEPQKIKLREVKAPPDFVLDERLYGEYEIKPGETLEITLKNTPMTGRIRIQKVSSGYNQITKDKEGAGLKATFEVYDKDMVLVDTIETSSKDGYGTSKELPLGVYGIKEKRAPEYYKAPSGEDAWFYCELKVHGDLLKFVVKNAPIELETTIEKRGVVEGKAGESILYQLSNIENKSNVPLEEFYVHDVLPAQYTRLEKVWTGVWSEREKFDFQIKTNNKPGWRTVKSGLLSTNNNEIDCSPSALGLASGEYVVEFRMFFTGEVQPGFKCTTGPTIQTKILNTVQNGTKFTNKVDCGGRYVKEWVYTTDGWTTVTFNKPRGKLPKTGYGVETANMSSFMASIALIKDHVV